MANPVDIELHASGQETSDASGAAVDLDSRGLRSAVQVTLTVTAITGSAVVFVETSPNGTTGWRSVGQFDAVAAVGRQSWSFDQCDRYARVRWDLTGSGAAMTFAVAGAAHVLYGEREDLAHEINAQALQNVDARIIARCRVKASCDAEAALATGYEMPLTEWPESIGQREAAIAVFLVMRHRGFKPGTTIDDLVVKAHDDAQRWLKDVGAGRIKPPGMTPTDNLGVKTSSGDPEYPQVYPSKFSNNWGDFG